MAEQSSAAFLDQLISHAGELYTLPTVALEVVRLADQPDVDTRAMRQCIENDPALTAKILKVVNSSLFGLGRKVGDLNQAIGRLGVKPLKLLALGFSLPKELLAGQENPVLAEYWRRSLLKAAAAREICRRWWHIDGDDAFVAGLLQDVGSLVLLKALGSPYEEMLIEAFTSGDDPRQRERAAFGFDRTAVSAALLARWGLPGELTEAIASPEAAGESGASLLLSRPVADQQRLAIALRLASLFADVLTGGDKAHLARLLAEAARTGSISWEQIEAVASGLQVVTRQLTEILSLPRPEEVDYDHVLARAHQQLAGLAAEAAADLVHERGRAAGVMAGEGAASISRLVEAARAWPFGARAKEAAAPVGAIGHTTEPMRERQTTSRQHRQSGAAVRDYSHEPVLIDRAVAAVEKCRRGRTPLSLALVAIDDFDRVLLARGPQGAAKVMRLVEQALEAAGESGAAGMQLDERCYAVLMPACDKSAALGVTRQVMTGVEQRSASQCPGEPVTMSAGLATLPAPAKGFPVPELVAAAERCLHSAQRSGGRTCKSIDIF